jgi:hypothetical protein
MKIKFFASPSGFRKCLEANHDKAQELWVGFYKKTLASPASRGPIFLIISTHWCRWMRQRSRCVGGRWVGVDLTRITPELFHALLVDSWSLVASKTLTRAYKTGEAGACSPKSTR